MAATTTSVVYVKRRNAKAIKTWLEQSLCLDRRFRMSPVVDVVKAVVAGYDDGNLKDSKNCRIELSDDIILTRLRWHNNNSSDSSNDHECDSDSDDSIMKDCIAVPVTDAFLCKLEMRHLHHDETLSYDEENKLEGDEWDNKNYCKAIIGFGRYKCPFSTSMLGNHNKNHYRHFNVDTRKSIYSDDAMVAAAQSGALTTSSSGVAEGAHKDAALPPLTTVQHVLIDTLTHWQQHRKQQQQQQQQQQKIWQRDCDDPNNNTNSANNVDNNDIERLNIEMLVRKLSYQTCPKKLEIIGDDRTLVIPHWAFLVTYSSITTLQKSLTVNTINIGHSCEFRKLLVNVIYDGQEKIGSNISHITRNNDDNDAVYFLEIQSQLWEQFATVYQCTRIVRRGEIDPNSGTRESGHRILWPPPALANGVAGEDENNCNDANDDDNRDKWLSYNNINYGYIPKMTGPDSPGWITVTEHGIHQSYDISRVMFSRGNVTEKARFGMQCVQTNEDVLDMYAGIGYFTLPALIHGKARHVTACEWNVHAICALRYNLLANGIGEDRVTILEGDCRANLERLLREKEVNANDDGFGYDRISLGLLPSSEGGWAVALSCLNQQFGGWLHVHANVPTRERHQWTCWLGQSLANIASIMQKQRRRLHLRNNKLVTEGKIDSCISIDTKDDIANEEDNLAGIDSINNIKNESNDSDEWIAVVQHVERVKSFAPLIDHLVADVFVGPCHSSKAPSSVNSVFENLSGRFTPNWNCTNHAHQPTCALNKDGVLHQHWLRG